MAIIAETVYFIQATESLDPTLNSWSSVLCGQVAQTTSIITACFLHIKPFLRKMDLGLMDVGRHQRQHSTISRPSMSRPTDSPYLSSNRQGYFSPVHSQRKESPKHSLEFSDYKLHGNIAVPAQAFSASQVAIVSTPPPRTRERSSSEEPNLGGRDSRNSMRCNNIHQVTTFGVNFERGNKDRRRTGSGQAQ